MQYTGCRAHHRRAGVPPASKRLALAGETPALHIKNPDSRFFLHWLGVSVAAFIFTIASAFAVAPAKEGGGQKQPNIIVLLCDDLGYGDVQCLNPERGKIPTPHLDALAKSGMIFTDAHSASAVCTPTRYGLMTGRYPWRTTLQKGVVQGFAPALIAADRPTVASFLKSQGYHTAILGKWHLNFLYTDPKTGAKLEGRKVPQGLAPVGSKIPDGPTSRGFDSFHGFHHAGDMECVIENDAVVEHDDPINMLPRLTKKAVAYLDERAKDKNTPFFLYLPYGSPHAPIVPSKEWQGKSGLNAYADFVMQNDDSVGQILAALEKNGQRENTLILFSSDNGCSAKTANIKELNKHGHFPSAGYRGYKTELWEGGHRVPFLASWPARIQPGSTNNSTICLNDLFATCAELLGVKTPPNSCEDSVSFLPAFQNQPIPSTRAGIVHHSINGFFSYRSGDWKLLLARDGGAASERKLAKPPTLPKAQLYDLASDPAETTNLYETNPTQADELLADLKNDIQRGRSTDGPESANDIKEIVLWKSNTRKNNSHQPK
jgi:arylsulfatase A-like enzyme